MKEIRLSDITIKKSGREGEFSLSFKEKIEIAKLLDRLGVSVIELDAIRQEKTDSLLIKSVATAVKNSVIAVPVGVCPEQVAVTWQALKTAEKPRLQVCAPVSTVQMEYLFHKKPAAMLDSIRECIAECKAVCPDVEFVAQDATRSDEGFLYEAVTAALEAGATTVTVCDTAGTMLPEEFGTFVQELLCAVPALNTVCLGVSCSDELAMADACAMAAIARGAGEIKVAAHRANEASLANVAKALSAKGGAFGASCPVRMTELKRVTGQICQMCQTGRSKTSPFDNGVQEEQEGFFTAQDTLSAVVQATEKLGYDLSEEDSAKVYDAFRQIAALRQQVSLRELDAIVASAAMQVPPTYTLDNYVITAGNAISATAHMKLRRGDKTLDGISIGDGPIDAAFLAIEQITGHHYELDDFQIQAVTEGREAMGQTVVKLRSSGKLYSGKGISTDIVGASIRAYLNALNKIVYEEDEV